MNNSLTLLARFGTLSLICTLFGACGSRLVLFDPLATAPGNLSGGGAAPNYTVTYDGNGNTGGTAPNDGSSPYSSGSTVSVLENTGNLVKTSFVFAGWNTASNGAGTTYPENGTFALGGANVALYAKWSPPSVDLAFGGGSDFEEVAANTINDLTLTIVNSGVSAVTFPIPTTPGPAFGLAAPMILQSTTCTGTILSFDSCDLIIRYTPTALGLTTRPLTITFDDGLISEQTISQPVTGSAIGPFTVTYMSNGSTSGTAPVAGVHDYDSEVIIPENTGALAKAGFIFSGWNSASNGSGDWYSPSDTFEMGPANLTLYAEWAPPVYYVSTLGSDSLGEGTLALPYSQVSRAVTSRSHNPTLGQMSISVAGGTYNITSSQIYYRPTGDKTFAMLGGWSNDFNTRNVAGTPTILSDVSTGNHTLFHYYPRPGSVSATLIDGITFKAGAVQASPETTYYYGLHVQGGKEVTVNNCSFDMDYAYSGGIEALSLNNDVGESEQSFTFSNNKIVVKNTSGDSAGLVGISAGTYLASSDLVVKFYNNLIYISAPGTVSGQGFKLFLGATNNYTLRNNTVLFPGGVATDTNFVGLYLGSSVGSYHVDNNIIFSTTGTGLGISYASGVWGSLKNNDIYQVGTFASKLLPDPATAYTTLIQLNGLTNASGNIADNPTFINPVSDWHLNSSASTVIGGGIDGLAAAWGFTQDITGAARTGNGTTGWSMGAYETDVIYSKKN